MAMKKWSDEEIQDFLDRRRSQEGNKLSADIQVGEKTRMQVKQYAALYDALDADVPELRLSSTFSNAVMARIRKETSEAGSFSFWQIVLTVLGFVTGTGVAAFFLGAGFFAGAQSQLATTAHAFVSYLSNLNINFGLLGTGLFMLVVMIAIDHILNESRQKLSTLLR